VLGSFLKYLKATISVIISFHPSVVPHGTALLPVEEFL